MQYNGDGDDVAADDDDDGSHGSSKSPARLLALQGPFESSHGSSLCGISVVRHKVGQDQLKIEHDVGESRNIGHGQYVSVHSLPELHVSSIDKHKRSTDRKRPNVGESHGRAGILGLARQAQQPSELRRSDQHKTQARCCHRGICCLEEGITDEVWLDRV